MDQSISALAFKGSILEAITEAKRQKKLFVVYISGDDEDSISMDKSTWLDSRVAESLSKYCILLHILEGSTDAAQFSALYPQKSAPCITAIGYNGVQLWQNEGFVSAEVLTSNFEKAWLSIHVQETTATFLTAALASRQSEPIPSEAPPAASRDIGNSSSAPSSTNSNASASLDKKDVDHDKEKRVNQTPPVIGNSSSASSSTNSNASASLDKKDVDHDKEKRVNQTPPVIGNSSSASSSTNSNASASLDKKDVDHDKEKCVNQTPPVEEIYSKLGDDASHRPLVDKLEESNVEKPLMTTSEPVTQVTPSASESGADTKPCLNVSREAKLSESLHTEVVDKSDLPSKKSTDIYLNIRLPGGASLREKFEPTSTLRMVKDYVDEKQESSIGSYDLAVPYPRKVFTDQDLSKTLTELNLLDRQALIVVPHLQPVGLYSGRSSVPNQSVSTSAAGSSDGESYFSLVKRYLSYVNPLAYLGGGGAANSSTSVQETQRSMPESGNFMGSRRSYLVTSNQSSSSTPSTSRNNKPSSSRFGSGSNIHTLKHDDDDAKFSGKNAFWNGNSTEYGGDGDNK